VLYLSLGSCRSDVSTAVKVEVVVFFVLEHPTIYLHDVSHIPEDHNICRLLYFSRSLYKT